MSTLTYNGIQLEILDTLDFRQQAQYSADGTTYLYTRYEVEVECVFNPKATSYRPTNPGAKPHPNDSEPVKVEGQMAGITTAALQHKLSQPRGKLLLEPNCVFLNGFRTPAAPMADGQPGDATEELQTADRSQIKPGGMYFWQMSGVYYYALRKPMDLNSSIVAGKMPFDTIKVVGTVIPASSFKTDLLKLKPDESSPDVPVTHPNWPGNDTQFLNPFMPSP